MNTIEIKNQTTKQTGAEALVSTLIENGIDTVFGYPGSPILSIYEAFAKTNGIRHILTRHEQGAVHAAEGWARISKKCGVVLTTSGPGFTNTITGIFNAHSDNTPLLIITGETENLGNNEFQEVDLLNLTKTFTKKTFSVTKTEDISKTLTQALSLAAKFPMGPVVVGISANVLENAAEQKTARKFHEIKVEAPHSCVLKAIDRLKNANRPLIIAGGGCSNAEAEIRELHKISHIPVVHTLMAHGVCDNISMGMIGSDGNNHLNDMIKEADVVLALGTRFTDRTTNYEKRFLPNSKIITINVEQNTSKNVRIDKEIIGELKVVLQQIIGVIEAKKILFGIKYEWIKRLSHNNFNDSIRTDEFNEESVLKVIHKYTKKYNPIITTDVGKHQISAMKVFESISSKNFLTSGGFGTMGYGLPAAIGAYIAKPNSLVMNITGDASFQMNIQELGTCAEHNLPIKIIIMNNSSLGMIKSKQTEKNYYHNQTDLLNPDFVTLANSYGIKGYTITNMTELTKALDEIFIYQKPVVLDIKLENYL